MEKPKPDILTRTAPQSLQVLYPDRDGKPMGESDLHIQAIAYLLAALRYHFRDGERVYVAANMLLYYEEGVPSSVTAPDVFVVKGVHRQPRRSYKLWEEEAGPCVVFEITSKGTRLEDQGTKRALYEFLGVAEYFLFDPLDEYLKPRFQGFRLHDGTFRRVESAPDGTVRSEELDLTLQPDGALLRVLDPATGQVVPTLPEAMARGQAETQRAKTEAQRAKTEAQRAKAEAQRADAAEAEVARLRAQLGKAPKKE